MAAAKPNPDDDDAWLTRFLSSNGDGRELREFKRRERLFQQGTVAKHIFLVRRGWINLIAPKQPPEICGTNVWLFEHVHELGHIHLQSAVALTDGTVMRFEAESFQKLLAEHPPLQEKFLTDTARRVGEHNHKDEPAKRRLAYVLYTLCEGKDFKILETTPTEMGRWIGKSRQTVDTILHGFEAAGLVKKLGRGRYHLKKAMLEQFLAKPSDGAGQ